MADPHAILGVSPDVGEDVLRKRYLELVRRHPPEKCPQQFAEIRAAYEQLCDPVEQLKRQVFEIGGNESLDDVIAELRSRLQAARIPTETLLSLAKG